MSDARPLLIVNPNAGGGASGRTLGALVPAVERALGPVDLVQTERPGHAIEIAQAAAKEGRARLLAAGGDGTVHEVANGILLAEQAALATGGDVVDATLGIIGRGTGGDLARTLGIRHELEGMNGYLGAISRGRVRAIDVGRARYDDDDGSHERFFVNILSAGLSGLVVRRMAKVNRALGPAVTYFNTSVRALLEARRAHLRVHYTPWSSGGNSVTDEALPERTFDSYMVAICNGRYFGAGMHVAPMADPADGRFDVVSIDATSKLAFFNNARRIWSAGHMGRPGVTHFACRHLRLELALDEQGTAGRGVRERFVNDIDGEPLGGLPLEILLIPQALRIFC